MNRTMISMIAAAGMALSLAACKSTDSTMTTSGASTSGTTMSGSKMMERGNPSTGVTGSTATTTSTGATTDMSGTTGTTGTMNNNMTTPATTPPAGR